MGYKDDKDIFGPSASRQEYFSRSDKGRMEALRREIRDKKGKDLKSDESKLKAKVNLKQLKNNVSDKKDEEQKRTEKQQQEDQKNKEPFGTKTRKQEEKQEVEDAQVHPSPERLIQKEKRKEEKQEQAAQEYQQDAG